MVYESERRATRKLGVRVLISISPSQSTTSRNGEQKCGVGAGVNTNCIFPPAEP